MLYDDGAWCLMNLSQSLEEPELHFETQAVDFIFVAPQALRNELEEPRTTSLGRPMRFIEGITTLHVY